MNIVGVNIVGQDSTLRSLSSVHDKHNKSLGRASYNKAQSKKNTLKHDQHKMPYIVEFAAGKLLSLECTRSACAYS